MITIIHYETKIVGVCVNDQRNKVENQNWEGIKVSEIRGMRKVLEEEENN